ncbi:hypothetical protein CHS0354_028024 [Potamilus streckersoni]|uniref:Uncharacterized protein n=1 Tax=Potamilus streckersoni TaxID=2493646 RepID=A0AAE0THT5_9BIVA|nr:hypothetical protein CHS0354_028024 [Potamilus streckersoni]
MQLGSVLLLLCLVAVSQQAMNDNYECPMDLRPAILKERINPVINKHEASLLLLLGFSGFSVVVAVGYKLIRKHVYRDSRNFDTVFDAGGRVTVSLTAVTLTSQLLWPADFLQSSTMISKSGLGGAFWFSIAIVIDILLFPILSLHLKTRAPGAKTFTQIVYSRFGKAAHLVYCVVALIANLVTTSSLILAGKAAIQVLTKDTNNEFIMLILAVLFGSYCLIGGLGTTFYISYFNTALTFISVTVFILKTSYFSTPSVEKYATTEAMYKATSCIRGPDGNYNNSYLTFRSESGILYGVVLLFEATCISFLDQANWQSRIAAKPTQGVIGFIIAAYLWFSIPTSISFTATMAYFSLSFQNNQTHPLSSADIDNGYITPYVMESLMGTTGAYLLMTMLMMALMSTGSGEIMSVSSIIIYDFYKTHVNPFRKTSSPTCCILCGEEKVPNISNEGSICTCPTSENCKSCIEDIRSRDKSKESIGFKYNCQIHGKYRHYEDMLMQQKSWCMIWVVILMIPYGLLILETNINLTWAVYFGQTLLSPFLPPIFLTTMSWTRATSSGVISGGVIGLVCAITGIFAMASTYEGGLGNFFTNTAREYSLLVGLGAGVFISSVVCVVISLRTHKITSKKDAEREWEKTMNIDNPLNPYSTLYRQELELIQADTTRITTNTMARIFRRAKLYAILGCTLSIVIFLIIFPAVALSFEVVSYDQFKVWLSVFQIWNMVGTFLVIVIPPVEEGIQVLRQVKQNKKR